MRYESGLDQGPLVLRRRTHHEHVLFINQCHLESNQNWLFGFQNVSSFVNDLIHRSKSCTQRPVQHFRLNEDLPALVVRIFADNIKYS